MRRFEDAIAKAGGVGVTALDAIATLGRSELWFRLEWEKMRPIVEAARAWVKADRDLTHKPGCDCLDKLADAVDALDAGQPPKPVGVSDEKLFEICGNYSKAIERLRSALTRAEEALMRATVCSYGPGGLYEFIGGVTCPYGMFWGDAVTLAAEIASWPENQPVCRHCGMRLAQHAHPNICTGMLAGKIGTRFESAPSKSEEPERLCDCGYNSQRHSEEGVCPNRDGYWVPVDEEPTIVPAPDGGWEDDAEREWERMAAMSDEEIVKEHAAGIRAKMLETARKARAAKERLMADPTLYRAAESKAEAIDEWTDAVIDASQKWGNADATPVKLFAAIKRRNTRIRTLEFSNAIARARCAELEAELADQVALNKANIDAFMACGNDQPPAKPEESK